LRQHEQELEALGVRVAIVTFEAGFLAQAYVRDTELRWPLLVDRERALYHAYGMLRAGLLDVWGPKTWVAYARALLRGGRLEKGGEDVYQRGGDVLIDPAGVVRLHHVGDGPADRPSIASLLAAVRDAVA